MINQPINYADVVEAASKNPRYFHNLSDSELRDFFRQIVLEQSDIINLRDNTHSLTLLSAIGYEFKTNTRLLELILTVVRERVRGRSETASAVGTKDKNLAG